MLPRSSIVVAGLVCLELIACGPPQTAAPCTGDQDCALEGGGRCLPSPSASNACAYPDPNCASGYHWGDLAGGGIAGQCVNDQTTDAGGNDSAGIDGNGVADPFVMRLGTTFGDSARTISPAGAGIVVTGDVGAVANFGGGPLSGGGYIARFDFDGAHIWSRGVDTNGQRVVVDNAGDVLLGGSFSRDFTLGGPADTLTPMVNDGYVAKLAGTSGAHLWSKRVGGPDVDMIEAIATFSNGDVLIAGRFRGTINVGGGNLSTTATAANTFIARLAGQDGTHVWSTALGGTEENAASHVSIDSAGDIFVAGYFRGTITKDGYSHSSLGESNGFVEHLSGATGQHIWSAQFGGVGFDNVTRVEQAGDGDVLIAGEYTAAFSIDSFAIAHAGNRDAYVAKLALGTGTSTWAVPIGGTGNDTIRGVAEIGGRVVVGMTFEQSVTFGAQLIAATAGSDILIARLSLTGVPAGGVRFGGAGNDSVVDFGAARDGTHVVIAGAYYDSVDFGIGTLQTSTVSDADGFAGKLVP